MTQQATRYNNTAIIFHWLTAILIIGMLGLGKFMTTLDQTSALRFSLTQWHKSFGLLILALSLARLGWRLVHRAPGLPVTMGAWERLAAHLSHLFFYILILFLPISGWLMVSASPLNISTFFFNVVKIPHLPWLSDAPNREELAVNFLLAHEYASIALVVLLVLHISAAIRHQFILRDKLMTRMTLDLNDKRFISGLKQFTGVCFVVVVGSWLFVAGSRYEAVEKNSNSASGIIEGNRGDAHGALNDWRRAEVNYTLLLMGDELTGSFSAARAVALLNLNTPENSTLNAVVETASGMTGTPQVDDTLPSSAWFDSIQFPEATFTSIAFSPSNATSWMVTGKLKIRDVERTIVFPMDIDLDTGTAYGRFTINRLDFDVGTAEQPGDSQAGLNVVIDFKVNFSAANND